MQWQVDCEQVQVVRCARRELVVGNAISLRKHIRVDKVRKIESACE